MEVERGPTVFGRTPACLKPTDQGCQLLQLWHLEGMTLSGRLWWGQRPLSAPKNTQTHSVLQESAPPLLTTKDRSACSTEDKEALPPTLARTASALALALCVVLGLQLGATPAHATPAGGAQTSQSQRQKELDEQMKQLSQDLKETSRELAQAHQHWKSWHTQLNQAQADVEQARQRLKAAQKRDAAIAARYRQVRQRELRTQRHLQQVQAQMDETQDQINALASAAYQQGRLSEVAVYLQATSPEDVAAQMAYTENQANSEDALLQRLAGQKAVVEKQKQQLETDRLELVDLRVQAQQVVKERQDSARQARQARKKVAGLTEKARQAKEALAKEKASEQARYDDMQAESNALKQRLQARAAAMRSESAPPAAVSAGGFMRPTVGPITSSYGWRKHPLFHTRKLHDGTDFGGGCGTPLYAVASGTVVEKRYSPSWGNRVVIELGSRNGRLLAAGYSHLQSFAVSAGQKVNKGQVIGYTGTTGFSTACHLHFNFYVDGSAVNPMSYL